MSNISRCCIALLLITALLPLAAYADQPPTVISGSITIDGEAAPAGTVVRAVIDGAGRAQYTVSEGGEYALVLTVDATDTGKSVLFLVDGIQAPQTVVVPDLPSGPIQLDLLITTTLTGAPTETEPPAPADSPVSAGAEEGSTPASQQHQQPIVFTGRLAYQNATVVPAGAEVCAYIDGELRGSKATIADGQYGIAPGDFDPLAVTGDSRDNDRNITFTVDGVRVREYQITDWVADALGSPHTLDLIVGSGSGTIGLATDPGITAASKGGQKAATDEQSSSASIPGFIAPLAIIGLLVACLLNRRKRKGDMI